MMMQWFQGSRGLKRLVGIQMLWLSLILLLGFWWSRVALNQAQTIYAMKLQLGVAQEEASRILNGVSRMVFWESSSYFGLLILVTLLMFWFYWKEIVRSRSLQAFFASMTHELKTPLTSLRLQAESLQELSLIAEAISKETQKNLTTRFLEDLLRLEAQVERTLELARVEGQGSLHLKNINLLEVLRQSISPWEETYGKRFSVEIITPTVSWNGLVYADEASLLVILRNILDNSVRHAMGDESLRMQFGLKKVGDEIILTAEDFPEDLDVKARNLSELKPKLSKMGRLYERGPGSKGTGIGLYLIQSLMKRMGGSVKFLVNDLSHGFVSELHFVKGHDR